MNIVFIISIAAALLAGPTSLLFLLGFTLFIISKINIAAGFGIGDIYMISASYGLYSLWYLVILVLKNKPIHTIKRWHWLGLFIGCCIAGNMIFTGLMSIADYRGEIANRETLLYILIIAINPLILTMGLLMFLYKKEIQASITQK